MSDIQNAAVLHIAFYPWFAFGHLTPFLRLANKLAERGHRVSYFLPAKTQTKLASHNHHPDHLTFITITVPPVDGLPPGAETTNDVPLSDLPLLMTALDSTRDTMEAHLACLKPHYVLYDFAYWMPELARKLGIKSMHLIVGYVGRFCTFFPDLIGPSSGLPSAIFQIGARESEAMASQQNIKWGLRGLGLDEMVVMSFRECDAIGVTTCKEMEGSYCEVIQKTFGKPVVLAGPEVPKIPSSKLDEHFDGWLNGFDAGSVIYCALGSECVLEVNQFQELLLGLELTG